MLSASPRDRPNLLRAMQVGSVAVLRRWEGMGEEGGNNRGSFVMGLTHGFVGSWCMALQYSAEATWCDERGFRHPIPWRRKVHSARWMLEAVAEIGRYVELEDVAVGDLLVLPRPPVPWQAHGQRISFVHGRGIVNVIDGNVGSFRRTRGKVREIGPIDLRTIPVVGAARYY